MYFWVSCPCRASAQVKLLLTFEQDDSGHRAQPGEGGDAEMAEADAPVLFQVLFVYVGTVDVLLTPCCKLQWSRNSGKTLLISNQSHKPHQPRVARLQGVPASIGHGGMI